VRRSDPRRLTQLVAPKQTGTPSFTQPHEVSAPMRGRAVAGRSTASLAVTLKVTPLSLPVIKPPALRTPRF
jgi:hypothetical protein